MMIDVSPQVLIGQDGQPLYSGVKYIIHNPVMGGGTVYLSRCMFSDFDISTPARVFERNLAVWKVAGDDKQFVVTGGNESNLFKIMKYETTEEQELENEYKLMY
ncbi:hypothetical protein KY290_018056 [Solanum tuberosum]|uniref:Uncharacterized protein n=1 Tax=Solanum tuberosum TaxID=4113 RepID=A0ABQ7VDX2_SOLTU|nr:hypothetical protein KY285_017021 [Solanum tuberosum]KAH0761983.1 hypothetical protein KY290_018056 [Solanum tuberosum]